MPTNFTVSVIPSEHKIHIEGTCDIKDSGEWAILMVDYLRQVTIMITDMVADMPGNRPDPIKVLDMLCDFVRKDSEALPGLTDSTEGATPIVRVRELPDEKYEIHTCTVGMPMVAWARLVVDMGHHFGLSSNTEQFQRIFDAEISDPSGSIRIVSKRFFDDNRGFKG